MVTKSRFLKLQTWTAQIIVQSVCPICLINADGSDLRIVTDLGKGKYAGSPSLSPDGKVVAFDTWFSDDTGASRAQVYTVGLDGKDLRKLTLGSMPSWLRVAKLAGVDESKTSDSTQFLTFFRHGRDFGVWAIAMDGSRLTQMNRNGNSPRSSPDGAKLAYIRLGGDGGIMVANLQAPKEEHKLVAANRDDGGFCEYMHGFDWSSDGKQICTQCKTGQDTYEVRIVTVDSGEIKKLDLVTSNSFSWSSDGRILCAALTESGFSQLYTFRPDDEKPALKLLPGQPANRHTGGGVWTADGKQIIFTSESPAEDE